MTATIQVALKPIFGTTSTAHRNVLREMLQHYAPVFPVPNLASYRTMLSEITRIA